MKSLQELIKENLEVNEASNGKKGKVPFTTDNIKNYVETINTVINSYGYVAVESEISHDPGFYKISIYPKGKKQNFKTMVAYMSDANYIDFGSNKALESRLAQVIFDAIDNI